MSSGLLSLKWNNHRSTFFHVLSSIRSKESYCDATLACDGRFYPVHKLVLSTCSEYFEQIFERTQCKHPVIVLKDIKFDDLEALMNYMYVGEVNVLQEKLAGLIKAAECLKIKGLAVPDEDPLTSSKRIPSRLEGDSPHAKRRRREDSYSYEDRERSTSSRSSRLSHRDQQIIPQLETCTENSQIEQTIADANIIDNHSIDSESEQHDGESKSHRAKHSNNESGNQRLSSQKPTPEVSIDETSVKSEPPDIQEEVVEDSKEALHSNLGFNPGGDSDSVNADPASVASGSNEAPYSDSNIIDSTPQSVEDVVAQAIPQASSNFQGNSFSLWEGEGSLQNFPGEGFSGENSQGRPMFSSNVKTSFIAKEISKVISKNLASFSSEQSPLVYVPSPSYETPNLSSATYTSAIQRDKNTANPRRLLCKICKTSHKTWLSLKLHQQTHSNVKQYSCPQCSYKSFRKQDLSYHFRTHTGEKPYSCSYCPHKSSVMSNMKTHVRRKHPNVLLPNN